MEKTGRILSAACKLFQLKALYHIQRQILKKLSQFLIIPLLFAEKLFLNHDAAFRFQLFQPGI